MGLALNISIVNDNPNNRGYPKHMVDEWCEWNPADWLERGSHILYVNGEFKWT